METTALMVVTFLVHQSLQIAALVVLSSAICIILRRCSAQIRYLLWMVVLIKGFIPGVLPVPVALLSPQATPDIPVASDPARETPPTIPADNWKVQIVPGHDSQVTAIAPAWRTIRLAEGIAGLWLLGTASFLGYAGVKAIRLERQLRSRRKPVAGDLAGIVEDVAVRFHCKSRVFVVPGIGQPFVWGFLRGAIYLPADFELSADFRNYYKVLAHEFAHVVRWDPLANAVQVIAQAVFFFHPFVWFMNRMLRMEREKCCDEIAIATLDTSPREYGAGIVQVLMQECRRDSATPTLAVGGSVRTIEERIRAILRPGRKFSPRIHPVAALGVILFAVLALPTALVVAEKDHPPTTAAPAVEVPSAPIQPASTAITTVEAATVSAPQPVDSKSVNPAAGPRTYVVQPGDTLSKVSVDMYGSDLGGKPTTVQALFDANKDKLDSTNPMIVGQKLVIPELTPATVESRDSSSQPGSMERLIVQLKAQIDELRAAQDAMSRRIEELLGGRKLEALVLPSASALTGTWWFDNPDGDEEQMAIDDAGHVAVLYSNGHRDTATITNDTIELAEYGGAKALMRLEDGVLIQEFTPAGSSEKCLKRWTRIDPRPRYEPLRSLSGETAPSSVKLATRLLQVNRGFLDPLGLSASMHQPAGFPSTIVATSDAIVTSRGRDQQPVITIQKSLCRIVDGETVNRILKSAAQSKDAQVLSSPVVLVLSGQEAVISVGQFDPPSATHDPTDAFSQAGSQRLRQGFQLSMTPKAVGPDQSIPLSFRAVLAGMTLKSDQTQLSADRIEFQGEVLIPKGKSLLVHGISPDAASDSDKSGEILLLISPSIESTNDPTAVSPDRNEVKSTDDLPTTSSSTSRLRR